MPIDTDKPFTVHIHTQHEPAIKQFLREMETKGWKARAHLPGSLTGTSYIRFERKEEACALATLPR